MSFTKASLISLPIVIGVLAMLVVDSGSPEGVRELSRYESSLVRGTQFGLPSTWIHPFSKCGVIDACKANSCNLSSNPTCSGWETTPEPDAPNQGCVVADWLSQCSTIDYWNFGGSKPCAKKGPGCLTMVDDETGVINCVAGGGGFVMQPIAPDICISYTLP